MRAPASRSSWNAFGKRLRDAAATDDDVVAAGHAVSEVEADLESPRTGLRRSRHGDDVRETGADKPDVGVPGERRALQRDRRDSGAGVIRRHRVSENDGQPSGVVANCVGQLSLASGTPSLSSSESQASPSESPSAFAWSAFATAGQLSIASRIPSPSASVGGRGRLAIEDREAEVEGDPCVQVLAVRADRRRSADAAVAERVVQLSVPPWLTQPAMPAGWLSSPFAGLRSNTAMPSPPV